MAAKHDAIDLLLSEFDRNMKISRKVFGNEKEDDNRLSFLDIMTCDKWKNAALQVI